MLILTKTSPKISHGTAALVDRDIRRPRMDVMYVNESALTSSQTAGSRWMCFDARVPTLPRTLDYSTVNLNPY